MATKTSLLLSICSLVFFTTFSLFLHAQKNSPIATCFLFDSYHDIWFWCVLNMGVVFFWRGSWGLLDLIVFPNNLIKSYSVSLAIGIFLLGLAYALGHTDFSM